MSTVPDQNDGLPSLNHSMCACMCVHVCDCSEVVGVVQPEEDPWPESEKPMAVGTIRFLCVTNTPKP